MACRSAGARRSFGINGYVRDFFLVLFVGIVRVECKKNRSPRNRKDQSTKNVADERITFCRDILLRGKIAL